MPLRVAGVHPVEVSREQRRFRATGAGADFDDRVARVGRIGRQDPSLHLLRQALLFSFEPGNFFSGKLGQFRIRRLLLEQSAILFQLPHRPGIGGADANEFLEPRVFAGQLLGALFVVENLRIAQGLFDFAEAPGEFAQMGP